MLLVRNFERIGGQPKCGRSRPHSLKPMNVPVSWPPLKRVRGIHTPELDITFIYNKHQLTEDVGEHVNHLTAVRCLSMLQRIPRRALNGQPRNTEIISSGEAPSPDPAEKPQVVAAAVRIHESAVLNHESAP
jgi:hypothetical protein